MVIDRAHGGLQKTSLNHVQNDVNVLHTASAMTSPPWSCGPRTGNVGKARQSTSGQKQMKCASGNTTKVFRVSGRSKHSKEGRDDICWRQ